MTACSTASRGHDEAMTRIIGGAAGGRRIATPRGANTRPTSDRVREALFSAVESWCGSLSGLRFLDLYAGSGAVGLEALVARGRGGHPRRAGPSYRLADLRPTPAASASPAPTWSRPRSPRPCCRPPKAPYDVVFVDPPYAHPRLVGRRRPRARCATTAGWCRARWWSSSAARGPPSPPGRRASSASREKKYGETMLWYVHAAQH